MSALVEDAIKFAKDVQCGGKLGPKSSLALADLLYRLVVKVVYLEKQLAAKDK